MDEIAGLNRSGKVVDAVSPDIYNASHTRLDYCREDNAGA